MVSAWQEPPSVIPAEWSAEATAVGRCRRHSNQSLGLERRCHTVAYLGLLRLRPGPAREVFWTWPWEPLAACQSRGLSYSWRSSRRTLQAGVSNNPICSTEDILT